jgi:dsDNA-specific endonuclease/ATPase MutS2
VLSYSNIDLRKCKSNQISHFLAKIKAAFRFRRIKFDCNNKKNRTFAIPKAQIMTFKQAVKQHNALSIIAERLELCSLLGRQRLYATEFSTDRVWIEGQFSQTEQVLSYLSQQVNRKNLQKLRFLLKEIYDIGGSLRLMLEGSILEDISLFEIKVFALRCEKIRSLLFDLSIAKLTLPNLSEIVQILDPEGLETQQFYVYSAYHSELAELRKKFNETGSEDIFCMISEIENDVRTQLTEHLTAYIETLQMAMDVVADIDLAFAKAELTITWDLHRPQIAEEHIGYIDLIYPVVAERFADDKTFQPITISIENKPVLITGANMAGKTLILKSLSFAQYCLQFGFFTAASQAKVCLVEGILCSIGDYQNETEGLSSFAAEILNINEIITLSKNGKRYLILVDELARTTNPYEGASLVKGFINVVSHQRSMSVITTHYSVSQADAKRLRVKGFISHNLQSPASLREISKNIDYSLTEDNTKAVPQEALNLARLLSVDVEWLNASM